MLKPSLRAYINNIIKEWGIKISIKEICDMWNKPHRYYHTVKNHLEPMLLEIVDRLNRESINYEIFQKLIIAALFHDIIYNPKSETNEDDSVSFLMNNVETPSKFVEIINLIIATKNHKANSNKELDEYYALHNMFIGIDLQILRFDFTRLLKWEKQIQKEYEFVNWKTYKEKRIEILRNFIDNRNDLPISINYEGLLNLINYIETQEPKIAIYAGSFNPFHIGHLNVLEKAEKIFDKVIIAKGKNDSKKIDEIEFANELQNLKELFPYKEVITYEGLLTDLIDAQEGNITLVRGLRNGYDLVAENTLMSFMKDLLPGLQVIYLPCDKKHEHISSSSIRSLRKYGLDKVEKYLP